jgi:hypothetical protein
MQNPISKRFIVQIVEGPPRGDLFELEQATFFHIIDTTTDQIIFSYRGDMEASLSRDDGQWGDYYYSGVRQVTISEDQRTALIEYFDGNQEQVSLPEIVE